MAPKTKEQIEQAKAKAQAKVHALPPEQAIAPPAPAPVKEQGICINCKHLVTGSWRGPTCSQPASPEYKKRVRDEDTCELFSSKRSNPVTVSATSVFVTEADASTEGQYDPTPLSELLARETEAPQDARE
jgi:hypothetical protein